MLVNLIVLQGLSMIYGANITTILDYSAPLTKISNWRKLSIVDLSVNEQFSEFEASYITPVYDVDVVGSRYKTVYGSFIAC